MSECNETGRREELKTLRAVAHAGSNPATRTMFKTEEEKRAYQFGWNDGFDTAIGPGRKEFYAKNTKGTHSTKTTANKRGAKIRLVCKTDASTKGGENGQ